MPDGRLRGAGASLGSIKEIIEGRDEDYAKIIRSLVSDKKVSGKLRKTYPGVFEGDVVPRLDVRPK